MAFSFDRCNALNIPRVFCSRPCLQLELLQSNLDRNIFFFFLSQKRLIAFVSLLLGKFFNPSYKIVVVHYSLLFTNIDNNDNSRESGVIFWYWSGDSFQVTRAFLFIGWPRPTTGEWPRASSVPMIRRHTRFCARYKCFTLHYKEVTRESRESNNQIRPMEALKLVSLLTLHLSIIYQDMPMLLSYWSFFHHVTKISTALGIIFTFNIFR